MVASFFEKKTLWFILINIRVSVIIWMIRITVTRLLMFYKAIIKAKYTWFIMEWNKEDIFGLYFKHLLHVSLQNMMN